MSRKTATHPMKLMAIVALLALLASALPAAPVQASVALRYSLSVSGSTIYTSSNAPVGIASGLSTTAPAGQQINSATVLIGDGFTSDDRLDATIPDGSPISMSYDANSGVLSLSGAAYASDYQVVLSNVTFSTTSTDTTPRTVTFSLGSARPYAPTGHFFEYVPDYYSQWTDAKGAAAARTYFGRTGYLATINDAAENAFATTKLNGHGAWIGGSDAASQGAREGYWTWVTGPEAGNTFCISTKAGSCLANPGWYQNFTKPDEPNNYNTNENYLQYVGGDTGTWNDLNTPGTNQYAVSGYVVEYGGMPGDDPDPIVSSVTVNVSVTSDQTFTVLSWADPAPISFGTALGSDQLNASANDGVSGTFTYTPASGEILTAGSHTLHVSFIPDNPEAYTSASKEVTLTVRPVAATITFGSGTYARYPGKDFALDVTTTNTDIPRLTVTVLSGPCEVAIDGRIHPTDVGTCEFQVDSPATLNFTAATTTGEVKVHPHTTLVCYVSADAEDGADTGASWADAFLSLQSALLSPNCDEIWVAAGIYKPTTGTDREATFQLVSGVAVYGGFAGTETQRSQRDPAANLTVLSGDLGEKDSQSPVITDLTTVTGNTDNSYLVVTTADEAVLDGFTITGAYDDNGPGGGIFVEKNRPVLSNLVVRGNLSLMGGGIIISECSPELKNITVSNNVAWILAGGVGIFEGNPALENVTISDNLVTYGSALFGIAGGAGLVMNGENATLTNVTISGNRAPGEGAVGGGIYNFQTMDLDLRNVILWGNTAQGGGDQLYNMAGASSIENSIVQGGCPESSTCTDILTGDPLLGPLGSYGGTTPTIPLLSGSPAINAGDDDTCASADQRGVERVGACDLGAFETRGFTLAKREGDAQSAETGTAFTHPLKVTVTAKDPGVPVAGGVVTFTAPGSGASASFTGSPAAVGADGAASVTASANGTTGSYTVNAAAAGAESVSFTLTNLPPSALPATATALSVDRHAYRFGESWTLTAVVSADAGTPTGTVTFKDGNTVLGTGDLTNGTATLDLASLPVGAHAITAEYNGDDSFAGSVSEPAAVQAKQYVLLMLIYR
jgi:hypothetical protein